MPIHLQLSLTATPDANDHTLTDTRRLAVWFAEHADIVLPTAQYDFRGRFTPGTPDRDGGRHPLLKAEASTSLSYGWRLQDVETVVDIRLIPRGPETVVIVQHSAPGPGGPADAPISEDFWYLSLENLRVCTGKLSASLGRDLQGSKILAGRGQAADNLPVHPPAPDCGGP